MSQYDPYINEQKYFKTTSLPKSPRSNSSIENYAHSYNSSYSSSNYEPPCELWFDRYLTALHILAQTYDVKSEQNQKAMKCFIICLCDILPNSETRQMMSDFISMKPKVMKVLFDSRSITLNTFFKVNSQVITIISASPDTFLDYCLASSDALFMWTYLFHAYYDIISKREPESYNNLKTKYDRQIITKPMWANPLWWIIHYSAYYAPKPITSEWKLAYVAFMSCLQNVLPCSICRAHIKENLPKNDIQSCFTSSDKIFEWTWKLHNTVNESLQKPLISLEECKKVYDPYLQNYVTQNSNMTKY